jgi:hypothetical protein
MSRARGAACIQRYSSFSQLKPISYYSCCRARVDSQARDSALSRATTAQLESVKTIFAFVQTSEATEQNTDQSTTGCAAVVHSECAIGSHFIVSLILCCPSVPLCTPFALVSRSLCANIL